MQNVITYIDGFNLYFGLREKGWKRFYWINLVTLAKSLLKPGQKLKKVKYFTSRITLPPDKAQRQNEFIEALETLNDLSIYYGKYQANNITCKRCGCIMMKSNEKMTDVNIAVEMLTDAFMDSFDVAILISADSDLVAPIKSIKHLFPGKQVIIAFPPSRFSFELKNIANATFPIGRKKFKENIFPDQITKPDGHILCRPKQWDHPENN